MNAFDPQSRYLITSGHPMTVDGILADAVAKSEKIPCVSTRYCLSEAKFIDSNRESVKNRFSVQLNLDTHTRLIYTIFR